MPSIGGWDLLYIVLLLILQIDTGWPQDVHMLNKGEIYMGNVGERLELDCQFYAAEYDLFDNPLLWRKTQKNEVTQINMMRNLNPPFRATQRFDVRFVQDHPQYTLTLSIKELTLEDSGNYTCEIRGPQSAIKGIVTHLVHVKAPVASVYLGVDNMTNEEILSQSSSRREASKDLALEENKPTFLQCVSHGGYPPPNMQIMLGRKEITTDFHERQNTELRGVAGLRIMEYTQRLFTNDFRVRAADDGKKLRCLVTVSGQGTNSTVAKLKVNYAPIVFCTPTYAYLGDKNVHIKCRVKAQPEVAAHYWVLDDNGTTVTTGEVIDEFWTLTSDNVNGGNEMEATLYLREVRQKSFRTYRFIAENSVAVKSKTAELVQMYRTSSTTTALTTTSRRDKSPSSVNAQRGYDYFGSANTMFSHYSCASSLLILLTLLELCIQD